MRIAEIDVVASAAAAAATGTPSAPATAIAAACVEHHVASAHGEPHRLRAPRRVHTETGPGELVELDPLGPYVGRAGDPERQDRRRRALPHRDDTFVVGVEHRGAITGQRLDELAPSREPPRRCRRRVRCGTARPRSRHPIVGRPTSHSRRISPNPRIPISSTSTSVSSGAPRIVTGRPCSLLKLRCVRRDPQGRPDGADDEILGARLADTAGDPDDAGGQPVAGPRRQLHQRPRGVVDADRRSRRPGARLVRYAPAPAASADSMKSWPSRSATIGTNS